MREKPFYPKVALGMFSVQMSWTAGFLGVLFIVNLVKIIYAGVQGNEVAGFFNQIFVASNIYMLIIGIIAINFLPFFVGNGVTRKDYFAGGLLAAIALSIVIPIVAVVVSIVERLILSRFPIEYKVQTINEVTMDGNLIGDIVKSIIIAPYVDIESNLFLAACVLSLNMFAYYVLGWLISVSFYKYDFIVGIVMIALAVFFKMMYDTCFRMVLGLQPTELLINIGTLPASVAFVGILLIIIITIMMIRMMTKKVAIKI